MARPPISLAGRVAVITGSSRGIGRAIAEAYGRAGARVVVSSSQADSVEAARAALAAAGVVCIGVPCDVADREQVARLRDAALAAWGQIDIWVNNAGISGPFAAALDVAPAEWRRVIEVNVLGAYHGSTVVLPHMIERRYGKIINLSGGGAKKAQRFLSAYSTSKAAIVRLTEGLARDYQGHRYLSINVLTPGIVPTDMTDFRVSDAQGEAAEALKVFPRIMKIFGTTAEETADLALHMASGATDGVSGKVFEIMPRRRALWRLAQAALRRV